VSRVVVMASSPSEGEVMPESLRGRGPSRDGPRDETHGP
jgi:hypothetical protein